MLVQLLPEQIANNWHLLVDGIKKGLQPLGVIEEGQLNDILETALTGQLQVWLLADTVEDGYKIKGIVTTCITIDPILGTRNLLMYSVYGIETLHMKLWVDGLNTLKKFAQEEGCKGVSAFSNVPDVVKILGLLGANTSWYYISLEV